MFAIVNESSESKLTPDIVTSIAAAIQTQIVRDYASLWQAAPVTVRSIAHESDALPGEWIIFLLDSADVANALGYHATSPGGRPYARVFVRPVLDNGGSIVTGAVSVSCAASHEALEALGDPYCNGYSDSASGAVQFAQELADPVEGSAYDVNGVSVSDFVGPRWFDPQDTEGPWDMMGVLHGPMTIDPAGYVISRPPGGSATSTFGLDVPTWKKAQKLLPGSRFRKRRP
jgi:hypothetical protein